MAGATLAVKILADIADFERNLPKAERAFLRSVDTIENAGKKMALAVTLPIIALGAAISKAAADDEASVAKLNRTFGSNAKAMESWIAQLMQTVPATDDELRGLAVSTDTLLRSMGLAAPAAQKMTQAVTKLAGDLAAYGHVEIGVAQDTLESALAGKTKGLTQFGIVVNEADIKTRAYAMGLATVGHELTHAQTAQAAWSLILEKSKQQQGEAARTIDDDANALKRFRQAADGVADSFGAAVVPTFSKAINAGTSLMKVLADLPPTAKGTIVVMGGIAASVGPAIIAFGDLARGGVYLKKVLTGLGDGSVLTGLKALGGLGVGASLIALPLLAIANAFDKEGKPARDAAAALALYKDKLDGLTEAQLKNQAASTKGLLTSLGARRTALQGQLSALPAAGTAEYDINTTPAASNALYQQLLNVNRQIAALQPLFDATTAKIAEMNKTAAGDGGSPGVPDTLKDVQENAQLVLTSIEQMNKGWTSIPGVGKLWIATLRDALKLLDSIPNKLDPVAVKAREIAQSLQLAFSPEFAKDLPVSYTPSRSNILNNLTPPKSPELPLVTGGLSRVEQAMRAGFQQVTVAIGDTLASNLAAQLGGHGLGAQIGGGIGGAFGSAAAGAGIQFGASTLLGMAGNAVVPVVGGIVGTLIGGALGGLFGRHKQKVDESANSLANLSKVADKVTESLSNLPAGFKIARARFEATVPAGSEPPAPGGPPGPKGPGGDDPTTKGNVVINGPITLNVSDFTNFVKQVNAAAANSMLRGGGGLTLSASRA